MPHVGHSPSASLPLSAQCIGQTYAEVCSLPSPCGASAAVLVAVSVFAAESPQAVKAKVKERTSIRAVIVLKKRILIYVVAAFDKQPGE